MRVKKELFPAIIVATLLLFIAIGLLLGFVPGHGGGGSGHGAALPLVTGLLGA
jgi:hypothetical protein